MGRREEKSGSSQAGCPRHQCNPSHDPPRALGLRVPSSCHLVLPDPDPNLFLLSLVDFEDQLIPLADQLLPLPAIYLPSLPFFSV